MTRTTTSTKGETTMTDGRVAGTREPSEPLADDARVPSLRSPSRRRRHPALGARIAATGLSATTMFGIIAGLGLSNRQAPANNAETSGPVPSYPSLVVADTVSVQPAAVVADTASSQPQPSISAATNEPGLSESTLNTGTAASDPPPSNEPVTLTANPIVRVEAPAPAPAPSARPIARTSGSR